jgi:predicted Zn-dependent peptidase
VSTVDPIRSSLAGGARTGAAVLGILRGSRDVTDAWRGLPHVVEHLLSATRLSSGRPLSEELERAGAQFNAVTTKEYVAVHARGPHDRLGLFNELLIDMWDRCHSGDWPWAEEIGAVRLELEAAEAAADDRVQEAFLGALFAGHELGQPAGGRLHALDELTPRDAAQLLASVAPGEVHLVNVGGDAARDTGASTATSGPAPVLATPPPPAAAGPRAWPVPDAPGHGYLVVGGRGAALAEPAAVAAQLVLSQLVGGATSSIFYRRLRSELGICYELGSWHTSYTDAGAQRTLLGLDSSHVEQACEEAVTLLETVANGAVDDATLDCARAQARTEWLIDMEDPVLHALNFLQRLRRGAIDWVPDEVSSRIDEVRADGVAGAAALVLDSVVAVHAPV